MKFFNPRLLLLTTTVFHLFSSTVAIGVNYGMIADNLPSPANVANFIKTKTIFDSVKIFDSNPNVLRAFANTNITMIVTISNGEIPDLNDGAATTWVNTNIKPFHPKTKIKYISLGNEVLLLNDPAHVNGLVPAMRSLTKALRAAGPQFQDIKVTSAHALNMFEGLPPPSLARFRKDAATTFFQPVLKFLQETNGPFMINPYPYFELNVMSNNVDYAVFRRTPGVLDTNSKLTYTNALDSLLDKTISAMTALGFKDVNIVLGETGWPSLGDPGNKAATIDNAASYNGNLIKKIMSGTGTPLMPNRKFEAYIFALFNENQKPGPIAEKNWGLFKPDMSPVYNAGALRGGPAPTLNSPGPAPTLNNPGPAPTLNNPGPAPTLNNPGPAPTLNNPGPAPTLNNPGPAPTKPQPTLQPASGKKFCVPKSGVSNAQLQSNLDSACGQGADCGPIQPGAVCSEPVTARSRATYAMNSFYRQRNVNSACDFNGTGQLTTVDPSYGNCRYP